MKLIYSLSIIGALISGLVTLGINRALHLGNPLKSKKQGIDQTLQRAYIYKSYGAVNNVLKYTETKNVPLVASHEVMVEIKSVSLNPVDYKRIHGYLSLSDMVMHDISNVGITPGFDFAGIIVAVGEDCSRLNIGDEVYGMALFAKDGTLQQYQVFAEHFVSLKPKSLSFTQAASLPLVCLTSLQALYAGNIGANKKVLILGGSGGTGSVAIQLAKLLGATEIYTTASSRNKELLLNLGATHVIDYKKEKWWEIIDELDLIYDCVGGKEPYVRSVKGILKTTGHYVTIVGDKQETLTVFKLLEKAYIMLTRKLLYLFKQAPDYHMVTCRTNYVDLDTISNFVAKQNLQPIIDKEYTFESAIEAFAYLEKGHAVGKVVINL